MKKNRQNFVPVSGIDLVKLAAWALVLASFLLLAGGLFSDPPENFSAFLAAHSSQWIGVLADGILLYSLYGIIKNREKHRLLDQMGSESNAFSIDAVRQIRRKGWLYDGTLEGRDFCQANLRNANLREANLKNCNFNNAVFKDALLYKANLRGCDLTAADLRGAELRNANLANANLRWADLDHAVLEGADLTGTDLRFAKLNAAALNTALTDGAIMNPILSEEEIQLVRQSFELLMSEIDTFTQHFYFRLFHLSPEVKKLFLGNMRQQRRKFIQTLDIIVSSLHDNNKIVPVLQSLGRNHLGYGVVNEHYQLVRSALLWALEKSLKYSFTPELSNAWTKTYDMVALIMMDAAENA